MNSIEVKSINERFAKFLGWVKDSKGFYSIPNTFPVKINEIIVDGWDMDFEFSWDWIMAVVERIENLGHEGKFLVSIERSHCQINDFTGDAIVSVATTGSTLDAVYSAINEFIFWYEEEEQITPDSILGNNSQASKVDWKKDSGSI